MKAVKAGDPTIPTPPAARSRPARAFARAVATGRLVMQVCADCGTVHYPAREICSRCLSSNLDWQDQERSGTLLASTTVRRPYEPYFRERPPKRIGLVRMSNGVNVIAFLDARCNASCARVRIESRIDSAGQGLLIALPVSSEGFETDDPSFLGSVRLEQSQQDHWRDE